MEVLANLRSPYWKFTAPGCLRLPVCWLLQACLNPQNCSTTQVASLEWLSGSLAASACLLLAVQLALPLVHLTKVGCWPHISARAALLLGPAGEVTRAANQHVGHRFILEGARFTLVTLRSLAGQSSNIRRHRLLLSSCSLQKWDSCLTICPKT